MSAGWASALVTLAALAGAGIGATWRAGRREGKLDAILENLQKIAGDHEQWIREHLAEHRARR